MKKRILWITLFIASIISLFISIFAIPYWNRYKERREWKEKAISEIVKYSADKNWIENGIKGLKTLPPPQNFANGGAGWLSHNMILFRNGEWLIYRNHCHKEPPHTVEDIFIAKGSNGKWYYTTCHFCIEMYGLLMDQHCPPPDISIFSKAYHLKEFDGISNVCLQKTQILPDQKYLLEANK